MSPRRPTQRFKIGALERLTGFTRDAIHYYVSIGLLPRPDKAGATVAWYDQRHVERLARIRALRVYTLSLPLIGRMLDAGGERSSIEDLEAMAQWLVGTARAESPAMPSVDAATVAFAHVVGLTEDEALTDPRIVEALDKLGAVDPSARGLALDSARQVVASTRALAAAQRKLTGAWLTEMGDGILGMKALRGVYDAVGGLAVAVREHTYRAETERSLREVLAAAAQATHARWHPAGSLAGAKGAVMLDALDARAAAGDRDALVERVRFVYGIGPARRLGEAVRAAQTAEVKTPWIALGAAVAALDAGDFDGARAACAEALTLRPGWALARLYDAVATLMGVSKGMGGMMREGPRALRTVDDAWPSTDESTMDRMWTLLVKVQTLGSLPTVLGKAATARAICEELLAMVTTLPEEDGARESGEAWRLEGNAWLALAQACAGTGDVLGEREALARAAGMSGPVAHAARARLKALGERS